MKPALNSKKILIQKMPTCNSLLPRLAAFRGGASPPTAPRKSFSFEGDRRRYKFLSGVAPGGGPFRRRFTSWESAMKKAPAGAKLIHWKVTNCGSDWRFGFKIDLTASRTLRYVLCNSYTKQKRLTKMAKDPTCRITKFPFSFAGKIFALGLLQQVLDSQGVGRSGGFSGFRQHRARTLMKAVFRPEV